MDLQRYFLSISIHVNWCRCSTPIVLFRDGTILAADTSSTVDGQIGEIAFGSDPDMFWDTIGVRPGSSSDIRAVDHADSYSGSKVLCYGVLHAEMKKDHGALHSRMAGREESWPVCRSLCWERQRSRCGARHRLVAPGL